MSLHDVVIELLYGGFPKSETRRDELVAAVEEDRAVQAHRNGPKFVPAIEQESPRYDPATGERLP